MDKIESFVLKSLPQNVQGNFRALYGTRVLYIQNKPLVAIVDSEGAGRIAIKVQNIEAFKKKYQTEAWELNGKKLEEWQVLGKGFTTKKNKLTPLLEAIVLEEKKTVKKKVKKKNKENINKKNQVHDKSPRPKKKSLMDSILKMFGL